MSDPIANSEVISAFVDNEPFDPGALARALAEPGGRDLLIDFIALRHVVNEEGTVEQPLAVMSPRSRWREAIAAAAVIAALAGGYAAGRVQRGLEPSLDDTSAPKPTRVVDLRPGVEWQPAAGGR
jgi:hypothetical protein